MRIDTMKITSQMKKNLQENNMYFRAGDMVRVVAGVEEQQIEELGDNLGKVLVILSAFEDEYVCSEDGINPVRRSAGLENFWDCDLEPVS
jgi:hypothetical protein